MKKKGFLIIFGILTIYFSIKISSGNDLNISNLLLISSKISIFSLFISIFFYNLGILLRAYRINYFIKHRSNLIQIIYLQYLTTGIQLLAPFRLGDGMRIYLFRNKLGNFKNSAFIFLIEKTFDFSALICILFLANLQLKFYDLDNIVNIKNTVTIVYFLLLTVFFIILYLVKKDFSYKICKKIFYKNLFIKNFLSDIKFSIIKFTKFEFIVTFFVSFLIWVSDGLSFQFIVYYFKQDSLYNFVLGPFTALSSILPSPPLGIYGAIHIGFYWMGELTKIGNYTNLAPIYSILIYGSAILIAFIFFIFNKIYDNFKKSLIKK